jgi:hypothetical protein
MHIYNGSLSVVQAQTGSGTNCVFVTLIVLFATKRCVDSTQKGRFYTKERGNNGERET